MVVLHRFNYVQRPPFSALAGVSRGARGLVFGLGLSLLPYFMIVRHEGTGETVKMHRLVRISTKMLVVAHFSSEM